MFCTEAKPGSPTTALHAALRSNAKRLLLAAFVSALLAPACRAQEAQRAQGPTPIAELAGQPIYESELPSAEQAQLQRMMAQVYAVRLRGFHAVIDQRLLEAEAQRRGITAGELIHQEVLAKVPEPTDDAVHAYFVERQDSVHQPFEAVKDQIRQGMRSVEVQKARNAYLQTLFQNAVTNGQLVMFFKPVKPEVTADPGRVRGNVHAPITIIEFSDYSCPFCRKAESTLSEVLAKYPGRVRIAYRDLPLQQLHPNAELAAEASRCAAEQGKYWDYHDQLFAHQRTQDREHLEGFAQGLGLDQKQFGTCLDTGRYKQQVESDSQMGAGAGVQATPGFFVEGTFVDGAQPAAVFEKLIDEKLAAQGNPSARSQAALKE